MPRVALSELEGARFDVVIIGAGVNGASAAPASFRTGHTVLIVDRQDFAAGASSRSGRLLHCGLRFLEPGEGLGYRKPSMWEPLLEPRHTLRNLRRARDAMATRSQIAGTMPERVKGFTEFFPVWQGDHFPAWYVGLGIGILASLGPNRGIPLERRRVSSEEAANHPLLSMLRDRERLAGVFSYREFTFDWSERIVMDTVLDAQRLGAVARNYTAVTSFRREKDWWEVALNDVTAGDDATVRGKTIINATGAWIDEVNRLSESTVRQRVRPTKGAHVIVRLPEGCAGFGIANYTRERYPFYVQPWRGLHYLGPTDTPYDGNPEGVTATEEEIEHLLGEANHLLPALNLKRSDVLHTYAGIRPMTYDPDQPMGVRGYTLHDLGADGLPDVFALTSGPILSHRLAGQKLRDAIETRVQPSGTPGEISYQAKTFPPSPDSPALLNHWPDVSIADLRYSAEHEQPVNLVDLLFRRTGAGWTETMAREGARVAAEAIADIMDWDEARIDAEVESYLAYTEATHSYQNR